MIKTGNAINLERTKYELRKFFRNMLFYLLLLYRIGKFISALSKNKKKFSLLCYVKRQKTILLKLLDVHILGAPYSFDYFICENFRGFSGEYEQGYTKTY